MKLIESYVTYWATLFNPVNGETLDLGVVRPDAAGDWALPLGNGDWHVMPIFQDWVLVMERDKG